jgi:hypothetical protein
MKTTLAIVVAALALLYYLVPNVDEVREAHKTPTTTPKLIVKPSVQVHHEEVEDGTTPVTGSFSFIIK